MSWLWNPMCDIILGGINEKIWISSFKKIKGEVKDKEHGYKLQRLMEILQKEKSYELTP